MKRGKKYQEAVKKFDRTKQYSLVEAVQIVKDCAYASFTETVEVSVSLSLKKSQSVRDTVVLPNQFMAEKKILVFAKGDKAEEAKAAGAAYVGDTDLIDKIKNLFKQAFKDTFEQIMSDSAGTEIVLTFVVSGVVDAYRAWYLSDRMIGLKQVAHELAEVISKGLGDVIKEA